MNTEVMPISKKEKSYKEEKMKVLFKSTRRDKLYEYRDYVGGHEIRNITLEDDSEVIYDSYFLMEISCWLSFTSLIEVVEDELIIDNIENYLFYDLLPESVKEEVDHYIEVYNGIRE